MNEGNENICFRCFLRRHIVAIQLRRPWTIARVTARRRTAITTCRTTSSTKTDISWVAEGKSIGTSLLAVCTCVLPPTTCACKSGDCVSVNKSLNTRFQHSCTDCCRRRWCHLKMSTGWRTRKRERCSARMRIFGQRHGKNCPHRNRCWIRWRPTCGRPLWSLANIRTHGHGAAF